MVADAFILKGQECFNAISLLPPTTNWQIKNEERDQEKKKKPKDYVK
jgi:hypothetical protein